MGLIFSKMAKKIKLDYLGLEPTTPQNNYRPHHRCHLTNRPWCGRRHILVFFLLNYRGVLLRYGTRALNRRMLS